MKKRVISVMLMLVLALTFTFTTAYAADQTITLIEKRDISSIEQKGISNTYFKTVSTSSGNIPAYCLNKGQKAPDVGAALFLSNPDDSDVLFYIMTNGYSASGYNSQVMGALTNEQAYYATQLAVWLYQGTLQVSELSGSNASAIAAKNLYETAKTYSRVSYGSYWTDLARATNDMKLNSDKTLYTSDSLKLVGTAGAGSFNEVKVTVTASNGSTDFKLVRDDGTEFKSGDKIQRDKIWYITIPADKVTADMKFTIKYKATWNLTRVYSYLPAEAGKQSMGVILPYGHSKDQTVVLSLKKQAQPTCEGDLAAILAATPEDKRTYDNAEYLNALNGLKQKYPESDIENIKNPSCTPVNHSCETDLAAILAATSSEKRTNDNTAYVDALKGLKQKYPESDIEDVANPSCTPKKVYNKKLVVHKQDASTKVELSGATLAIKDSDGNIVKQWVSTTEPYVITDLPAGKYTLVELGSPEGYELGDGVIEFELVGDEYNSEVTMYNSPIPNTADINFALIVTAFIVFLGFGIFGLVQASKREA